MGTARKFRENAAELLRNGDMEALRGLPGQPLAAALFAHIGSADPDIKWRAVAAMGDAVARIADSDMETARALMQRLVWSLNHESGGIGWGTPEAMAECLACHGGLAQEYTKILVSFMRGDGFYLELPALQRGLMWGISRLAQVNPELLLVWQAPRYLKPYLKSEDQVVRALAARALAQLLESAPTGFCWPSA